MVGGGEVGERGELVLDLALAVASFSPRSRAAVASSSATRRISSPGASTPEAFGDSSGDRAGGRRFTDRRDSVEEESAN